MNPNDITSLSWLYVFFAIVGSIFAARTLERRLKAQTPAARPYYWGFYVGCMGLACVPVAAVGSLELVVDGANGRWAAFGASLA